MIQTTSHQHTVYKKVEPVMDQLLKIIKLLKTVEAVMEQLLNLNA